MNPLTAPSITVDNLDAAVEARLRDRAARNHRSAGEEAGAILTETLMAPEATTRDLTAAIRRHFAAIGGVELAPHPPVSVRDPPRFEP